MTCHLAVLGWTIHLTLAAIAAATVGLVLSGRAVPPSWGTLRSRSWVT